MLDFSLVTLAISKLCLPFLLVMMAVSESHASQSKWNTREEAIDCYECKSTSHEKCNDPFNSTRGLFPLESCRGCCVKIVRNYNTDKESVWRTCTAKLEISNSLVHSDVCMGESNGLGHLCICSEDKCNSSSRSQSAFPSFPLCLTLAVIFGRRTLLFSLISFLSSAR